MATEPTATFTTIDQELFESGDVLSAAHFLTHVLQNLVWIYQQHDHSGDSGDGGLLDVSDPGAIGWFVAPDTLTGV